MLHHLLFNVPVEPTAVSGFILSGIKGIFLLIGGIIAMILCAIIAKSKGYSAILFGILGLFFSILTLIVVIVIPRRQNA
ncbi:deoxyribodipyrimidine photolyase [Nakamurella sp. PAMC28650]|jgi:uncharacterized membrane protein HdeD (DUF308 family)|uniref:deoxyribodipyrimidine photolyase n=1 Tax=Nakamurella sp. PAMC28650 TaxID=2762325 RepID=UPI00164DCBCA|nr:deoxyribodipyrimidine photolyase [Nakamurella sp. PAMC28650]QNK81057.1 deoxyribodipyrimidine photolyase [Nakamurella sp. PAMC28650]